MAKKQQKNEKSEKIDLRDTVSVVATESHPHATKGEEFKVHRKIAGVFLEKGYIEKFD